MRSCTDILSTVGSDSGSCAVFFIILLIYIVLSVCRFGYRTSIMNLSLVHISFQYLPTHLPVCNTAVPVLSDRIDPIVISNKVLLPPKDTISVDVKPHGT